MSKSYRGWAELEDWGQREIRRQHKRKSSREWKAEAMAEIEDTAVPASVYAIINEWDEGQEVVGGFYFNTEDDAWDHLYLIAESHGLMLDPDDTSINVGSEDEGYDVYYIIELVLYEES